MCAFFGLVLCMFLSIRTYGKIVIFAYLVFPTAAVLIILYTFLLYPKAGETKLSHERMLQQWKHVDDDTPDSVHDNHPNKGRGWRTLLKNKQKYHIKFLRSCRAIGFRVGNLFVVKPQTALSYMDMVIDQLINCLISTK